MSDETNCSVTTGPLTCCAGSFVDVELDGDDVPPLTFEQHVLGCARAARGLKSQRS
jgi:hypothetical protein